MERTDVLQTRHTQVLREEWEDIHFSELKKDDIFRLFEPTGEEVKDEEGLTQWRAISDPFHTGNGILTIETERAY